MKFNKVLIIILVLVSIIQFEGCSYSFTGASIPAHLNSIAIPSVKDRSGSGIAYLGQYFTDGLIQNFIDDNSLQIAPKGSSDALLECTLSSYTNRPETVSNDPGSGNTRQVKITVKVVYRDLVKKKKIFDKSFSDQASYSTASGEQQEAMENAIQETLDKIAEDIMLGVVSNW